MNTGLSRTMTRRFARLTVVAGLLCGLVSASSAKTLTPQQLRIERANSIVFLRDGNTEKFKGLGVLISDKGHILTAKHVYALFQGATNIQGSVGSLSAPPRKVARIDDAPSSADLILLQFTDQKGDEPAPLIASSKHLTDGATLRILTGILGLGTQPVAPGQEEIANIRSDVAARVGGKWQLSGAIKVGDSGSPAFDLAGNLVGLVVSGDSAASGKFHVLSLDTMHDWLKQKQVSTQIGQKTDRIVFYVRKNFDGSPGGVVDFNTFRAILTSNLNSFGRVHLPIKPVPIPLDRQRPLELLADLVEVSRDDFAAHNAMLSSPQVSAYIRGFDAASLFVLLLDVQYGELIHIRPVLIEIKVDGDSIAVAAVTDIDSTRASPDPSKILEPVKDLFVGLVQAEPDKFGANNMVFADCVTANWTPWNKSFAMQTLRQQLTDEWAKTKHRRYQIGSANPAFCDGDLTEEKISNNERAAREFAQHLLQASFMGTGNTYSARWRIESRDKKIGQNFQIGAVDLPDKPSGDMIPSLKLLIRELTKEWDRLSGP